MRDQAMYVLAEVMGFAEDEELVLAIKYQDGIRLDVPTMLNLEAPDLATLSYPNPDKR